MKEIITQTFEIFLISETKMSYLILDSELAIHGFKIFKKYGNRTEEILEIKL